MDVPGPDFGFATYAVHEEEIAARRRGATEADDIKLAPVSLLDVFRRYVVGCMVARRESAVLAERLIRACCDR